MLAAAFAADMAAVTPGVCNAIRDSISAESNPAKRDVLRHALVVLSRRVGDLAAAIDHEVRDGFDARLGSNADTLDRIAPGGIGPRDEAATNADLAAEECAAQVRERAGAELSRLTLRMGVLLGSEPLDDAHNPILPRLFVNSLMAGIAALGFAGDAKLAVFESYGPALVRVIPDIYLHANTLLGER
jgi:hypothetical protein